MVVTGVGSGIGRATALRLAADGATVYGVDLKNAKETADDPAAAGRIVAVEMDATDSAAWASLVEDVLAERGRIDSLVLVHGVTARQLDTVTDQTEEEWDFVLDVNLKGCWLGMRAVLPSMLANGGGSIVCTTSGAALGGINGLAAYSASKGGLISLIRQAATDYAPAGVRINGVAPGHHQHPHAGGDPQGVRRFDRQADPARPARHTGRRRRGHRIPLLGGRRLPDRQDHRGRRRPREPDHLRSAVVDFGLIYELQVGKPWADDSESNVYWQAIEQIQEAERAGFTHAWAVEHHFLAEFSHCSAPEVFLSAVAQHTSTIRIGQGVVLCPPPFNHPVRVAERIAVLDILSRGRVEFGAGRSITEPELGGFGIDPADSRPMMLEALELIPQFWMANGEPVGYEGKYISVPPRTVVPRPVQKPHPPMWLACTSPDTYGLAGELGMGVLGFGNAIDPPAMARRIETYRAGLARAKPVGRLRQRAGGGVPHGHLRSDRRRSPRHRPRRLRQVPRRHVRLLPPLGDGRRPCRRATSGTPRPPARSAPPPRPRSSTTSSTTTCCCAVRPTRSAR